MSLLPPPPQGLYRPEYEKDACGIGLVADLKGRASHALFAAALKALARLGHRGARGADGESGDGAGILTQLPDRFMRETFGATGVDLPPAGSYGIGVVFLQKSRASTLRRRIDATLRELGLEPLGWRPVPVRSGWLGRVAGRAEPAIWQVAIGSGGTQAQADELERRLFVARCRIERRLQTEGDDAGCVASFSSRTIVYKGMVLPERLPRYFPDLCDPRFEAALALVHARFSTNTFPAWPLAQPFRRLCHNGEINALRGNLAGLRAKARELAEGAVGVDFAAEVLPLAQPGLSDSAYLDQAMELLLLGGKDLAEATMILMPEAWEKNPWLDARLRAFYEYHATLMAPWDGPAAVLATDGQAAVVAMDRNGLRPCRYVVVEREEGTWLVAGSEIGMLDLPWRNVLEAGRVGPGNLLLVDPARGGLLLDRDVKAAVAERSDFRRIVETTIRPIDELWAIRVLHHDRKDPHLRRQQISFGYTAEELTYTLKPMAEGAEEAISSMGDDTPPAILSREPRLVFDYLRQQFAQVTNPPLDPLREELVFSTTMYLGARGALFGPGGGGRMLRLPHPIISGDVVEKLRQIESSVLIVRELSLLFAAAAGRDGFLGALTALGDAAVRAAEEGARVVILSDRGVDAKRMALPSLVALGEVGRRLLEAGLRGRVDLVVETGEARSVHHLACLVGFGAAAVHPYLAFDSIGRLFDAGELDLATKAEATERYVKAAVKGLVKIMSKMGISVLRAYSGAGIFEALGLSEELVRRVLPGTPTPIGGLTLERLADATLERHAQAFAALPLTLPSGGQVHYRRHAERHAWSPEAIAHLRRAADLAETASYESFADEANGVGRPPLQLRHLLDLQSAKAKTIDLSETEAAEEIVRRFTTGAMSLGAISREAHETLAIAMNRLGGKSNTGEGGEDPARFTADANGDSRSSAIKQIASARFGVTAEYLANGRELQIKIAQGAKPGEGGQLPGHKVDAEIARLRHATAGVALISPPPHHDIYSIEDLAQLIHDLRAANPKALVSVKLVATSGIGAIAAGVVKAGADKVIVACGSGGTGASPLSSIKHAGMPWEVGLAEVQQTLVLNGLRDRVRLEVDGQMKTGRDVVVAALLGAEEFGFATAPLIATGCVMMRKCHLNTCPVGIATQDPELRAKFSGKPEHVVRFFFFVADEARRLLASLGLRSMAEAIGRTDLLEARPQAQTLGIDLSKLLHRPTPMIVPSKKHVHADPVEPRGRIVTTASRSFGARLSFHRCQAPSAGESLILLEGVAGQSFGAFLTTGLKIQLTGAANDYVGKGLSGGQIAIKPAQTLSVGAKDGPILIGNTSLYGATSGALFVAGGAGERFAVRNSGADAVVEGVGDHGCEYMTGGRVVVLGPTGRNFAAGMTGGIAWVYDEDGFFNLRCNLAHVELERLGADSHHELAIELRQLIEAHVLATKSSRGQVLLAQWEMVLGSFVLVTPKNWQRAQRSPRLKEAGEAAHARL